MRNWLGRPNEKAEVFFCTMEPVRVREVREPGDGNPLPKNVTVQGLKGPSEGTYDLLNVLVQSNGDLRVIMDDMSAAVKQPEVGRYDPMFVWNENRALLPAPPRQHC
jgi:hypothetical protein